MDGAGGGIRVTEGDPEAGMGIVERPSEDSERVGSKRARDSFNDNDSHGFSGVTTSEKKAAIASGGTSKIGAYYLHGPLGEQMLPDSDMLRSRISSPGENLGHKFKWPNQICTLYAQGQCRKEISCTFLHEIGSPGFDYRWNNEKKACPLEAAAYGNPKGSEEGSVQHLSNLKVPQLGHHSDLTPDTYLSGRSTFPRLLDGGILQSADKKAYLGVNYSASKHGYRSFDLQIPSYPLQNNDEFPAYGEIAGNLPHIHNLSSHAPYTSYNLPDFRHPVYATSDHSFGSPTFSATSHLGRLSCHQSTHIVEKVGHHKNADVGTCTSSPALLPSSPPQPSIVSPGSLSPIKDEVWITSVPFVPSIDLPAIETDIKRPSGSQYDPLVDYTDSPKVGIKNNLKSSSISGQHTNSYGISPKSFNHDKKSATAKGLSNELARLNVPNKGHSSASSSDKTRNFRFRFVEHVKQLIKPFWLEGSLSKNAHKQVVKKSLDKILSTIEPDQVPTSEGAISYYITTSGSKIERLVKEYVDMHRKM